MALDAAFWFDIARGDQPISAIPLTVGAQVINFLNDKTATAASIFNAVPLLGEGERGLALAQAILDARSGSGFTSLQQVMDVPGVGPARFTEIVRSIANTDPVMFPNLASAVQPAGPIVSASETCLAFTYELLLPGLQGVRGGFDILPADVLGGFGNRNCQDASSCSISAPSFNEQLNQFEAQVQITGLILDGEDDIARIAIRMDHRMLPYDWIRPLNPHATQFQFPAMMQLNNSMILDLELKESGERMTLVSRDVPCQVGRVTAWPPYRMMLHTQDQVKYYNQADPLGPAVLKILDATTFLIGPENFLSARTDITRYEYIPGEGERGLPAVVLNWVPQLGGSPMPIHYYEVHRSSNPNHGECGWVNVSGPVYGGSWVDPNPPRGPLYYRVLPVYVDILGMPYHGFPGQARRVEPADSVFRY